MNRFAKLIKLVVRLPNFIRNVHIVVLEPQYTCPSCGVKVKTAGLCALCYMDTGRGDAD